MSLRRASLWIIVLVIGMSSVMGCKKATPSADSADVSASTDSKEDEEIKVELAKLSDEDRALAEKQKVCPVSGAKLGSMPGAVKVHVNDRDVMLCCDGCEEKLRAKPDEYLAKLPK